MTINTATTSYKSADGTAITTFLARPAGAGPFPALVMGYEFWGMLEVPAGGPHMRDLASRFAEAGYVAAVPDYYAARGKQPTMEGGTVVGSPPDAQSTSDLCDGVHWLQSLGYVDPQRVGIIGWCGGGRQALFVAAHCDGVAAAAAFYGRPVNRPNQTSTSPIDLVAEFKCPIFGAYGEADKAIPVETVVQFREALERQGKAHEIHVFPAAEHAFMNDRRPEGYNEAAATESWRLALDFFDRHLRQPVAV